MPKVLLEAEPKQKQSVLGLEVAELVQKSDLMLDLVAKEGRPERRAADRCAEDLEPVRPDVVESMRLGLGDVELKARTTAVEERLNVVKGPIVRREDVQVVEVTEQQPIRAKVTDKVVQRPTDGDRA